MLWYPFAWWHISVSVRMSPNSVSLRIPEFGIRACHPSNHWGSHCAKELCNLVTLRWKKFVTFGHSVRKYLQFLFIALHCANAFFGLIVWLAIRGNGQHYRYLKNISIQIYKGRLWGSIPSKAIWFYYHAWKSFFFAVLQICLSTCRIISWLV